jgi:hypothetical protein
MLLKLLIGRAGEEVSHGCGKSLLLWQLGIRGDRYYQLKIALAQVRPVLSKAR